MISPLALLARLHYSRLKFKRQEFWEEQFPPLQNLARIEVTVWFEEWYELNMQH